MRKHWVVLEFDQKGMILPDYQIEILAKLKQIVIQTVQYFSQNGIQTAKDLLQKWFQINQKVSLVLKYRG